MVSQKLRATIFLGTFFAVITFLSAASPKRSTGSTSGGQPRLIALPVEKCIECKSVVKKRIAVMKVKIGSLDKDLNMDPATVAAKVQDALEGALASAPGVIALNRNELGDVIGEQGLAASGFMNQELAPAAGKGIPAQLLLYASVDRINLTQKSRKEVSSNVQSYYQQADQLDQEAHDEEQRASTATRETYSTAEAIGDAISRFDACAFIHCYQPDPTQRAECEQRKQNCENDRERQQQQNQQLREQQRQRDQQRKEQEAKEHADRAQSLHQQAAETRQRAQQEASSNTKEIQTTEAYAVMNWKVVDTSTGAVMDSGQGEANDSTEDVAQASQGLGNSSYTSSRTRQDALINNVLAKVIQNVVADMGNKLEKVPFRVKVVKVGVEGVVLNAGKNLGLQEGDTFGVRQKAEVLTDPDTGELLNAPGPPIGVIRVSQVSDKTAIAQVIESAGLLNKGDELEWIGVFKLAESDSEYSFSN
jgi:Flagellar assembly protein T, C-terminal domain